ncbi:MAG: hypothetical protein KBC64_02890 [Simkaniaceae bacterium]|nr:hypothetical protein [Simkaniaceae bacterium]
MKNNPPFKQVRFKQIMALLKNPIWNLALILFCFSVHPLYSQITNLEDVQEKYNWMDELINFEFRSYLKTGINNSHVNRTIPDGCIRVKIINNEPQFSHPFPSKDSPYYSFYDLMTTLCKFYKIPDVEFIYHHHDGLHTSLRLGIPILAGCRRGDIDDVILFGDWTLRPQEWQDSVDLLTAQAEKTPWESRRNQIIWRGTNSDGFYNQDNCFDFSRGKVVYDSLLRPDIIDARFYSFNEWRTQGALPLNLLGNYLPPIEQLDYKYHLVITGAMGSYPNDRWKMFTGSTIFWIPHNEVLWYHYPLKPYVHYIPTTGDLDVLTDRYEWAESHPNEAKKIADNAKEFAKENLQTSHFLLYMYKVLKKYESLCLHPIIP